MSNPTISQQHKRELLLEIEVLRDNIQDVQSAIATAGSGADHLCDLAVTIAEAVATLQGEASRIASE